MRPLTKFLTFCFIAFTIMVNLTTSMAPVQAAIPSDLMPPIVIRTSPEPGFEQPLDEPITITFDQPMDKTSVEQGFSIEPGDMADGILTWIDDQTLTFQFKDGFQRGQRYRLRILETAHGLRGTPMNRPFELRFSGVGALEITQTQPADGDTEILPQTTVTIAFNRPVVPLQEISKTVKTNILDFEPTVTGTGVWLNTSIYQFTPTGEGFKPATTYTARLSQLTDTSGQVALAEPYVWTFNTVTPAVVGSLPHDQDLYVSPTPVITLAFNQPMNRDSVEQNLQLVDMATGQTLALANFTWRTGSMALAEVNAEGYYLSQDGNYYNTWEGTGGPLTVGVETVSFSPQEPLQNKTVYQLTLAENTAGKIAGTATAKAFVASFTTAPLPQVVSTQPENGTDFVEENLWSVEVRFNTPMSLESATIGQNLRLEYGLEGEAATLITHTEVFSYWYDSNKTVSLNIPAQYNTYYTMTLSSDITDRYGQPLAPQVITWKTLRKAPAIRFLSPRVGMYNGYESPRLYLTLRNMKQADFVLARVSWADFLNLTTGQWYDRWQSYKHDPKQVVRRWSLPADPEAFKNFVYELNLTEKPDTLLEPGVYYLEGSVQPESIYPESREAAFDNTEARVLLVVSKYNVTLKASTQTMLAWVTDLQTGQPVAGLPMSFMAQPSEGSLKMLGEVTTAADGVAFWKGQQRIGGYPTYLAVVNPTQPFSSDFAVSLSDWQEGITPYSFKGIFTEDANAEYNGYVYTDRNIYQAGQTMNFKGIIRADNDAQYTLPSTNKKVKVEMYDSQYNLVYQESLPLNAVGTFNGSYQLSEAAALGNYSINVNLEDKWNGYTSFNVAEYRKPEFLVTVTTDKAEYAQNDTIKLTAQAEFLAGGPVYDAPVRWTIVSADYDFKPRGFETYSFIDPLEFNYNVYDYGSFYGEEIASGVGQTDKTGRFSLEIPADITPYHNSQNFTLEVAVTGLNNQEVAQRTQAVVHKGDFYVGLRPRQYVGSAGEANQIEVVAVDWQGRPVAQQAVELILAQQQWYSVQQQDPTQPDDKFYWNNLMESVAVFTTSLTTDARGQAVGSFTPTEGGSYKVYSRARDQRERQIFASTYLWVSGGGYINWGQANDDRIELVADKTEYKVGETAQVLVPHPYSQTVRALITLERGHVYSHTVVTLTTNSDQLPIPITEALAPNVYVSAVVVQGSGPAPDPTRVSRSERILPSFKLGYIKLPINLAEKQLTITLTPNKPGGETYQPGETVSYDILVTHQGRPVQADLSLALIDKAVLALAPEIPHQLLDTFWRQRGLGVQTGSPLTLAVDRINRVVDAKKGGGGGGEAMGIDNVRENFADAPLWVANLETDAQGRGQVEVKLPDNLTTWVLIGKGMTGADSRVGESQTEIVTTKPIIVRPVMPRFLVTQDQARVGVLIQNNSKQTVQLLPYFEAPGLNIKPVKPIETLSLKAGEQLKVEYEVVAPNLTSTTTMSQVIKVTMAAQAPDGSAELSDALRFDLPLYHASYPETVATSGVMSEAGGRNEGIMLPSVIDRTQGQLAVEVNPSLAAGTLAGLNYLQHYPYESTEGIVSRFLPNVTTYRAYQKLNLDKPQPTFLVNLALQRLYRQQNSDGGWGSWSGQESNPFLTAYVVLGLVEAQKGNFTVSTDVLNRAVTYLQNSLVAPKDVAETWQGNRQAFILYVLAEADQADFSRAVALFDLRQQLDFFGRAYLALAMSLSDPNAAQIKTLLTDLTSGAIVAATGAHWEETQTDFYAMNTDTRSTAIIIAALARLQPDNPLLPQAVRWLMSVRSHGGSWETTQETAWAIIGLTDWMQATQELQANYQWQVLVNGQSLGQGEVTPRNLAEPTYLQVAISQLLGNEVNYLAIERDTTAKPDEGNLYYAAYLTYFKPLSQTLPLAHGLSVARQYQLKGSPEANTSLTTAQVGDIVEVKLTLVVPNDLHYVMVEDPLPAGMEALDSSLATTSIADGQAEFERTDRSNPWGDNHWFGHTEIKAEKVTLFSDYLPKGTYQYTYFMRASTPGRYQVIPTQAQQIYFPEVFGRSAGATLTIKP